MGIDRGILDQLRHLLRPLATRIANTVVRGVVHLADDGKKLQRLQFGALAGETIDDAEHFQPYGFTSVPLAGAEVVAVFPNGDRSHPLVIATSDRNHRPTGGQPGEVTMYNNAGAKMTMTKDGDIIASAAPGREVLVDDGSGGYEPLVKRSEFLAHGHVIVATGAVSPCAGPVAGSTPGSSATFPGTAAFKAK